MKRISALVALLVNAVVVGSAAPPARLHRSIDNSRTFVLEGHTRALAGSAHDLGELPSSTILNGLTLHFRMTPEQEADLNTLLAAQHDRSSKLFHKWLTPDEFGARFGLNAKDLNKIKTWLEDAGFSNVQISDSRRSVQLSGTSANVSHVFGVAMHRYERQGKTFYANANDPTFPQALEGLVGGLKGLSSNHVRPFIRRRPNPQISVGINGNHFLGPNDISTIYNLGTLYGQGTDGTGQRIVIVGQSDISLTDTRAFQNATGLPIKDPQVILAGSDPGSDPDNMGEADLDLEWSSGIARGATILYVNSPDALDSAVYAIENNLAPVISISYGLCEAAVSATDLAFYNGEFAQANAQGITVVVASGDTGAAACDVDQDALGLPETAASFGLAVSFPASSPYVTAVGGTEFDDALSSYWNTAGNAISYIPEIAWNDTSTFQALASSGGGASSQFSKPSWQQGVGVPNDGFRDVPDLAFSASPVHDPYLICSAGSCSNGFAPPISQIYFVGGTSCAAPVFSGILALLNQTYNGTQGNINPALYALASFNSGVFHDVELGNNKVPCVGGTPNCVNGSLGYSAGLGYDEVTGLGSLDATQFVEQWGSDFQLAVNPTTVSFAAGSSSTASIQVTRFNNFNGSVNFTCSVASSLTNTTCSVLGSVSGTGVATLTITNSLASGGISWRWFKVLPPGASLPLLAFTAGGLLLLRRLRKPIVCTGLAALCLLMAASCGSGNSQSVGSSTHTLTGNVVITATSGVLQHVVDVPVTIQ